MKKKLFIAFFTLIGITAFSQSDTSFQLLKVVKGDIVDFTVDNLDNIYVLNSRNQIRKYNANGDSVAIFNNVKKKQQPILFLPAGCISQPWSIIMPGPVYMCCPAGSRPVVCLHLKQPQWVVIL